MRDKEGCESAVMQDRRVEAMKVLKQGAKAFDRP